MDKARFDSEKVYQLTMSLARTMLRRGLISREEYTRIDVMMTQKYRPLLLHRRQYHWDSVVVYMNILIFGLI